MGVKGAKNLALPRRGSSLHRKLFNPFFQLIEEADKMEIINGNLFDAIDEDIRELLELIHNIKIDYMMGRIDKVKIDKAFFLTQKIQEEIYQLNK